MSSNVYDQHRKHTSRVGAYAILKDGQHVASITIAYPKDGASRLYAYVHYLGSPMLRGSATGYGYDKRSAAVASAARLRLPISVPVDGTEYNFWHTVAQDDGREWDRALRDAGFTVCCIAY